jgi:hypothetical protein
VEEDNKTLVALGQLHDDLRELIGAINRNYESSKRFNTTLKRLYISVASVAFILSIFWPWIYRHIMRPLGL